MIHAWRARPSRVSMHRCLAPAAPLVAFALWVAGLCAAAQFAKIGLILPELSRLYPGAGAGLGLLVSAVSVVGALLGLLAGALAARLGTRRLLLGGLALGATVSLLQALLPPLPVLLASRVVEGVAHLAIVVAAPTLMAGVAGERWRPAAMTLWGTFFGVAFALVAWLGLPLVAARGVGALFLAHGLCTAAVAAALVRLLPPEPAAGADPGPPFTPRGIARRHAAAWSSPSIAAPAAGWLCYTITFVALLAVLPGLAAAEARAFTAAALPLASIVSSMTLGVALLRATSAVRVIGIGFAAAALVSPALLVWPGEPLPCIALFAALGLVQGASFAAVPELNRSDADRALSNGALAQAGNVGNACGTPLVLAAVAAGGAGAMIALVIGCYAVGLAAHAWMARRRRARARGAGAGGVLTAVGRRGRCGRDGSPPGTARAAVPRRARSRAGARCTGGSR